MVTRNLGKIQEALNELNPVQKNINELKYYQKELKSPNHSSGNCSAVRSSITKLETQHQQLVEALLYYGTVYQLWDEEMARSNYTDYQPSGVCYEFSYTPAEEHKKGFWERTWNQVIYGDFSDDATWLGTSISVVAAFFGVDAPMDARDTVANASKGEWGWAALSAISLIPVVGGFTKIVSKGADIIDGGSTLIKQGSKVVLKGSDLVDSSFSLIKNGDELTGAAYKLGGKEYKTLDGVFTGLKNVDEVAVSLPKTQKVLWETTTGRSYVLMDSSFSIIGKTGDIEVTVKNVKYLPDFPYVKKAPEQLDALRREFNATKKDEFLKELAENHVDDLKKVGLTDDEIAAMKNGYNPDGFEVHHKLSLDDGGDNSMENLILIEDQYHDIFTYYQNSFTKPNKFGEDGYAVVDWIVPNGSVYLP